MYNASGPFKKLTAPEGKTFTGGRPVATSSALLSAMGVVLPLLQ